MDKVSVDRLALAVVTLFSAIMCVVPLKKQYFNGYEKRID
jgi:hypothetical protein